MNEDALPGTDRVPRPDPAAETMPAGRDSAAEPPAWATGVGFTAEESPTDSAADESGDAARAVSTRSPTGLRSGRKLWHRPRASRRRPLSAAARNRHRAQAQEDLKRALLISVFVVAFVVTLSVVFGSCQGGG